jgi:hypothetical protein
MNIFCVYPGASFSPLPADLSRESINPLFQAGFLLSSSDASTFITVSIRKWQIAPAFKADGELKPAEHN